jgi:TPR repeat protein
MDNIVIAMDYWKPLLKKADCDAQYRVGLVYFMGIDKPHDFKDIRYAVSCIWYATSNHD